MWHNKKPFSLQNWVEIENIVMEQKQNTQLYEDATLNIISDK